MIGPSTDQHGQVISAIWSALLHCEVAEDTNFFQAGGNSITAIRAAARLGAETGIDLPLRAFFDHPTVAELTAHIRQAYAPAAEPGTPTDRSGHDSRQ
jgi:hypothetical protein